MVSKNVNPRASALRAEIGAAPSSDGFLALLRAFFGSGGIARAIELEGMLQEKHRGDYLFKRFYRQPGLSAA